MTDVSQDIFLEKSIPRISRLDKAELVGDSGHTFGCFGDIRFKACYINVIKTSFYNIGKTLLSDVTD